MLVGAMIVATAAQEQAEKITESIAQAIVTAKIKSIEIQAATFSSMRHQAQLADLINKRTAIESEIADHHFDESDAIAHDWFVPRIKTLVSKGASISTATQAVTIAFIHSARAVELQHAMQLTLNKLIAKHVPLPEPDSSEVIILNSKTLAGAVPSSS